MLKKLRAMVITGFLLVACASGDKTKPLDQKPEFSCLESMIFFEQWENNYTKHLQVYQENPVQQIKSSAVFAIEVNKNNFITLALGNNQRVETCTLTLYLTFDSLSSWPKNFDSTFFLTLLNNNIAEKITIEDLQDFFLKAQVSEGTSKAGFDDDNENAEILLAKVQNLKGWMLDFMVLDNLSGTLLAKYTNSEEVGFADSDSRIIALEELMKASGYQLAAAGYEREYQGQLANGAIITYSFNAGLKDAERYVIVYENRIEKVEEKIPEKYINLLQELSSLNSQVAVNNKLTELLSTEKSDYDRNNAAYLIWRKMTIGEKDGTTLEYCLSTELTEWLHISGFLRR